jgi:hypothetical protein
MVPYWQTAVTLNIEIDLEGLEGISKKRRIRPFMDEYFVNGKKIFVLGEGRLINLAAAEGHPSEIMSMSFMDQSLAMEYIAKNYKSAQTLTFPITMLAMIPMFITMFTDFETLPLALKIFTFAIPFSHPMMAPRSLIFKDYLLVLGGIIYVTIFAIIIIAIVVWIFKTDRFN